MLCLDKDRRTFHASCSAKPANRLIPGNGESPNNAKFGTFLAQLIQKIRIKVDVEVTIREENLVSPRSCIARVPGPMSSCWDW
jgi:hypothetical protein